MIKLGELVMILDLHRQGLSVSAIARQLGIGDSHGLHRQRPGAAGLQKAGTKTGHCLTRLLQFGRVDAA